MFEKNRVETPVLYVLIGIMITLSFMAWSIFSSYQTEERLRSQATLSAAILNNLRLLEAGLLDAETGQRGYILTGRKTYLEPYDTGRVLFRTNIDQFADRIAGIETEAQISALAALRSSADQKLAELAETIRLLNAGRKSEALDLINTDVGKEFMDDIRAGVNRLEVEEQLILRGAIEGARVVHNRASNMLVTSMFVVMLLLGVVWYLFARSQKLNRTEELLAEVTQYRNQSTLLAQELSHRIKNLFGIISSIVRMTGRGETDAQVVVDKISERIHSLSRAHALTSAGTVEAHISLRDLIDVILEPYATDARTYDLTGDAVIIPDTHLTPLGLVLHELVTNAVKYGAWSSDGSGHVAISWTLMPSDADPSASHVRLIWNEAPQAGVTENEPAAQSADTATSSGFGTRMMQMSALQLGGKLEKSWENGLHITLSFDVQH